VLLVAPRSNTQRTSMSYLLFYDIFRLARNGCVRDLFQLFLKFDPINFELAIKECQGGSAT